VTAEPVRKVAFVTTSITSGGAEMMLLKVVRALDKSKFFPVVVVLGARAPLTVELERAGAGVVILGGNGRIRDLFVPIRAVNVIRRLEPAVLQGWMVHGNIAAQLAGSLLRIPVVWGVRHSRLPAGREKALTRFLSRLMRYMSGLPARIVYNSLDGRSYHATIGYEDRRAVVIPNGFDVSQFDINQHARARYRTEFHIAEHTIAIGMVARYHPIKDHANLLQAARILQERYADIVFLLVGLGCDTSNAELLGRVNQLGLQGSVLLLGERSDVHRLASAFDIGTLSSASEGFPNAIGELMACGVPCVVTNVGDSQWIVGETGITVPPRDPAALAEGILKMIHLGTEGRGNLGRQARARVRDLFSIQSISNQFEAIYREVT
jgi:glycosyltransferase involved in cell wall biosynthesis